MEDREYGVSADKVFEVYRYLKQNGRIDKIDSCYQEKIKKELEVSRSVVYASIKFLEDLGIIEKTRKGKKKIVSLA